MITLSEVRARALREILLVNKAAGTFLNESVAAQRSDRAYDIFLSHAVIDAKDVLGAKLVLEDLGYSVYVDWLEDPNLDRSAVSRATAKILRERMSSCRALFYAVTPGSSMSKWMQWECGYFDGLKGRTAVLPIIEATQDPYKGTEYLSLYPYIDRAEKKGAVGQFLWVNETSNTYVRFDEWLGGREPYVHTG